MSDTLKSTINDSYCMHISITICHLSFRIPVFLRRKVFPDRTLECTNVTVFNICMYKYELSNSCAILRQAGNRSQQTTSGERFVFFLTRFVSARKCLIWQGKNDGAENEKKLDFTHLGVREKETGAHFRKQKRFEDIDLVAITDKETCLWGVWHAKKSIHIFFAK